MYQINILSTYIPKTKTIQSNYPSLNHIETPNLKRKKITHWDFNGLMMVGVQYNRGDSSSNSSFSLLQVIFQSQVFYFDNSE